MEALHNVSSGRVLGVKKLPRRFPEGLAKEKYQAGA
jgi:hypothetical protein